MKYKKGQIVVLTSYENGDQIGSIVKIIGRFKSWIKYKSKAYRNLRGERIPVILIAFIESIRPATIKEKKFRLNQLKFNSYKTPNIKDMKI